MKKKPEWLLEFKSDFTSQAGEDGVIKKILEVLPENDKWCVEFGAWDGVYLSNVRNLITSADYSAVMIEASKSKYDELCKNYSEQEHIFPINTFVGFSDTDNLDKILKNTPIPQDFDLLSIDVDGNDYHIWKSVHQYKPKLVVVEFNQTIPTEISFVQAADPSVSQGSSLLAMVELGKEKSYELVCVLPFNAFFVKKEYFHLFEIEDNSPITLRKSLDDITYIFSGYDGKVFLRGNRYLPWHGMLMRESRMQVIPMILRGFPSDYTKVQSILWHSYLFLQHVREKPLVICKKIIERIEKLFS